jgi:hypothetical protein
VNLGRSFEVGKPRPDKQSGNDSDESRSDRGETAPAETSSDRSPEQQAVINQEEALESGEENPA